MAEGGDNTMCCGAVSFYLERRQQLISGSCCEEKGSLEGWDESAGDSSLERALNTIAAGAGLVSRL